MKQVYLDYAAATPLAPEALIAMRPYFSEKFHNPSAVYLDAHVAKKDIGAARQRIAHWLGARPNEIIFTAGGTESDNLAIHGVMQQYPEGKVLVSAVEHEAVLAAAQNYKHDIIPVDGDGRIKLDKLEKQLTDEVVLVSVMYANNEVGTIQPLSDIAKLIEQARAKRRGKLPLLFHSDATQAANYLDLHVNRLGVDLLSLNGGKIYGPKQSGCLYIKAGIELAPLIHGGGQEQGVRSGTENVAGIIGFATALDLVQTDRKGESKRIKTMRDELLKSIQKAVPEVTANGSLKYRLPSNLNFSFPGVDGERLVMELDEHGIQAATGAACSANKDTASHVLKALGLGGNAIDGSIRLTLGRHTKTADIDTVAQAISKLVKQQTP